MNYIGDLVLYVS